jgi:hypothetical protein
MNYVTERMEYIGSIHGFPAMPDGYSEGLIKSTMAFRAINECLERAKIEAWEEIKKRIEMEGVDVLKDIMEGGPIFKGPVMVGHDESTIPSSPSIGQVSASAAQFASIQI